MSNNLRSAYLGNNRSVCKTVFGSKIFVDTRDLALAPHLLLDGAWEMWITGAMTSFLKEDSVFLDVGANFGWYSLYAKSCGVSEIHAFEPNPNLIELLSSSFEINGLREPQSFLHPFALGDVDALLDMRVTTKRLGDATLLLDRPDQDSTQAVQVRVLDEVYKPQPGKSHVLKVDVEGFEPRVIFGAQKLLQVPRTTAFVEYHADPLGKTRLQEMLDLFDGFEYSMCHVQHSGLLQPLTRETLEQVPEADMLCFRRF